MHGLLTPASLICPDMIVTLPVLDAAVDRLERIGTVLATVQTRKFGFSIPEATMSAIVRTSLLIALTCSSASLVDAQSPSARSTELNFAVIKRPHILKEDLDSLIVFRPAHDSVQLIVAFDNACDIRPQGRYRLSADTLAVWIDYRPHVSSTSLCPAEFRPEEHAAVIQLKPGHYVVVVRFAKAATKWHGTDLWREIDVE